MLSEVKNTYLLGMIKVILKASDVLEKRVSNTKSDIKLPEFSCDKLTCFLIHCCLDVSGTINVT
jgi:hypothetical protein